MSDPKLYVIDEQEVLVFGDYVTASRPPQEKIKTKYIVIDGEVYVHQVPVSIPCTSWTVGFLWVREKNEEIWIDNSRTIDGGLSPKNARQLAKELNAACDWLEQNHI